MLTFPCSSQHLLLLCFALLLLCFASQAFYLATSVTLLSFFVALRNQQPFKFRDVKAVSILTATVVTLFIISVMLGNSGGTFHAVPGVIAMICGGARKRDVKGKILSVRVDLGGHLIIKKKTCIVQCTNIINTRT